MKKITKEEIKDYYDQRHLTFGENSWRPFKAYSIFLDYLCIKAGKKLLDIGCGSGYLLKAADRRGLETYGVDTSVEGVKIAKKVSSNSKVFMGEGEVLSFSDDYFDYITCLGALEHFLDIDKGIKEMVRVAKDNAKFCVVVPNKNYIFWKFKKKKGTEQQDINELLLDIVGWRNLLVKNGLIINKIFQDKWFMKEIRIFDSYNPYSIIKNLILKFIWLILPIKYAYQFIFICRKRLQ